jgi:hypothetical protein
MRHAFRYTAQDVAFARMTFVVDPITPWIQRRLTSAVSLT